MVQHIRKPRTLLSDKSSYLICKQISPYPRLFEIISFFHATFTDFYLSKTVMILRPREQTKDKLLYWVIQENSMEFLLQTTLSYIYTIRLWFMYTLQLTYLKGYVVYIRLIYHSHAIAMLFFQNLIYSFLCHIVLWQLLIKIVNSILSSLIK